MINVVPCQNILIRLSKKTLTLNIWNEWIKFNVLRLSFILQSRAFFVLRSFIRAAFSAFKVCCHYIVVISYRIWVLKFSVLVLLDTSPIRSLRYNTFPSRKMKSFIKNFFIKYHQIRSFVRIWLHLLKKSLMENFIFCVVFLWTNLVWLMCFHENMRGC